MNLLLIALVAVSGFVQAQNEENRECDRMRFLAGEAIKKSQIEGIDAATQTKLYQEASMYYLMGEKICGGFDKDNWDRLVGSLMNAVNGETDEAIKKAYTDTLIEAFDKQESLGFYNEANDLFRASIMLSATNIDRTKSDDLFRRAITKKGQETHESYIPYAYYNTYMLYLETADTDKPAMKKRLIQEYFEYTALLGEKGAAAATQSNLDGYLDYLVKSCDDLLPEIDGYIASLPEDKDASKKSLLNMIELLERKECDESDEYMKLIDALIAVDPTSEDAKMMKAKLVGPKEAIAIYRDIKENTTDDSKKQEMQYRIAAMQFKMRAYSAAYNSAMSVSGENRGRALSIAGQCVAANANNCGSSTFERKCNYIYAVQLLQQASSAGENVGGLIGSYQANFPTESEKFDNGNPASVSLSCYGVSVNP